MISAAKIQPWTDQYIGLPYQDNGRDRNGLDCWGLVRLVYAEQLGIALPSFDNCLGDGSALALRNVARTVAVESDRWLKAEQSQEFDVALFRNHGLPCHVGIICGRRDMLHIAEGIDSIIEPFAGIQWKNRLVGFYRYDR